MTNENKQTEKTTEKALLTEKDIHKELMKSFRHFKKTFRETQKSNTRDGKAPMFREFDVYAENTQAHLIFATPFFSDGYVDVLQEKLSGKIFSTSYHSLNRYSDFVKHLTEEQKNDYFTVIITVSYRNNC
jgi:hypothetical protein